ncbi:hypothetical protein EDD16DRAFT_1521166 [Pisolithus croceorrhizus]|nr:hypothetical protein EDD16DRAFT_1521166 [Pisolithus croceorrhizus]
MHEGQENFFHAETDDAYDITSILDGSKVIDLSHTGSELCDLTRDLFKDVKNIKPGLVKCQTDAFAREMPELVQAYLEWSARSNGAEKHTLHVRTDSDSLVSSALVHQGIVLCALLWPHTAITMDALELYHVAQNCCPHFSIQAFVKTISDPQAHLKGSNQQLQINCKDLPWAFVDQFGVGHSDESLMEPTADDDNPCTGRWKNMKEDVTSRMWGIFDEAGIFMAICRHGFSLVVTDIVWSGEQAKYLLAAVSKLLDMFGDSLTGSYDIGSRYVDGMGLEDLEGCEHLFSKTNGLVSAVHYASAFHHHQAIAGYIAHNDEHEVYLNLTTMIFNNYRQALHIIQEGKNTLPHLMDDLGIMDVSVFSAWLLEENEYLAAHLCEPEKEMLQMEYWQKLVNLDASWKHLSDLAWAVATPSSTGASLFIQRDIAATMRKETMRCHAMENFEKDLKMVQDLKGKLGITKCWVPEDEEWQTAGRLVANHKYQCCLNQLESLIVAQIFELSKMNQAGTGYKLCKHIAKALKLTFEEVVEYTFLTNFNLLHNATCEDISQHPWASPAVHAAMDHYFKPVSPSCKLTTPPLTYQAQHYHNIQARFTSHHLCLFAEISALHGFMGTILPGKSTKTNPGDSAGEPATVIPSAVSIATIPTLPLTAPDSDDDNSDLDEFDADEDEDGDNRSMLTLQEIIHISSDGYGAQEQH